jgi:hypothetical protein
MSIMLQDVFQIENLNEYKVHFAKWNGTHQPLDVFTRDRREWQGWQEYRPERDDFNRQYVFSLASFYHEPDTWLFGGVYEVTERHPDRYVVKLSHIAAGFIGRLKLRSPYKGRTVRVNMESQYADLEVAEILPEQFAGRAFPGYEEIELSFDEIETLVRNNRIDWRAALESMKGVYLITDLKTEKRYVGSAYGEGGIWSRWCAYAATGHGGNVELKTLLAIQGLDYCRAHFRFALLEHRSSRTSDEQILNREEFWKRLLLTRGQLGLNRN